MKPAQLGHFALRFVLGVNIAGHGLVRLPKSAAFAQSLAGQFEGVLPGVLVKPFALALPTLELLLGILILMGFRLNAALFAGALLIGLLTFGMTMREEWEVVGLQLVYALAYAFLLFGAEHARFTLDGRLKASGSS
jgi:thiosulfate dehydrogenase (quinone) large subunit